MNYLKKSKKIAKNCDYFKFDGFAILTIQTM